MSSNLPIIPNPRLDPLKKYSIQGVISPEGPQPRLNIVDFVQGPEQPDSPITRQWNLYLQALRMFQGYGTEAEAKDESTEDHNNPLGYYQVAGEEPVDLDEPFDSNSIHVQRDPWCAVYTLDGDTRGGRQAGNYCTHGTALFLTWHRPYMLLFEQRLVEEALKYASSLSPKYREAYTQAATKIRAPFWDWATNPDLPGPCRTPKISIKLPLPGSDADPVAQTICNPLWSYRFKSTIRRFRDMGITRNVEFWTKFKETKRCPDSEGNSQPEVVDKQLQSRPQDPANPSIFPRNWRDGMYELLTSVPQYGSFSNTGWQGRPPGKEYLSLENYHNSVHIFTGTDFCVEPTQRGHMGSVAVAAFDPVFWLHHSQVDRIYAMWQSIHYHSPYENQRAELTRLPNVTSVNAEDGPDAALRPFYFNNFGSNYQVWTNRMVQRSGDSKPTCFDYGYTYPEMPVSLRDKPELLAVYVYIKTIQLYGPYINTLSDPLEHSHPLAAKFPTDAKYRREWLVVHKVKRYLLVGNFSIFFFLRKPTNSKPHHWIHDENLVGTFSTFKSQSDVCANCDQAMSEDVMVKGGIDITTPLYWALNRDGKNYGLGDEEKIEGYLKDHLTWRLLNDETNKEEDLEALLKQHPDGLRVMVTSFLQPYPVSDNGFKDVPLDSNIDIVSKYMPVDEKEHRVITDDKIKLGGWAVGEDEGN